MRRRDLLGAFIGSTLLFRPLVGSAQRSDRIRRVGFLSPFREDDSENRFLLGAFRQTLRDLGWTEGGNISIEYENNWDHSVPDVTQCIEFVRKYGATSP